MRCSYPRMRSYPWSPCYCFWSLNPRMDSHSSVCRHRMSQWDCHLQFWSFKYLPLLALFYIYVVDVLKRFQCIVLIHAVFYLLGRNIYYKSGFWVYNVLILPFDFIQALCVVNEPSETSSTYKWPIRHEWDPSHCL